MDAAASGCFHCGEPLRSPAERVLVDGVMQPVCCTGCGAAAAWIRDAGLGDYYRLRVAQGARVDPAAVDYAVWDRDDVQAGHAVPVEGGREITVVVEGMRCAACAWLIDRALSRTDGVLATGANAVTGRVRIAWDPQRQQLSQLLSQLASLGYRPHLAGGEAGERERRRRRNRMIARLGVAALGTVQAMMYSEALYLDTAREMSVPTRDFFRWITFLVSTPVVFYSGWPFLAGLARELRARTPGMDTLVGGSVLLAYGASLFETLRGGPVVWFDAAVMFVFFLLIARYLEERARQHAGAVLDTLARARPSLAWRELDGVREQVPLHELQPGDVLVLAAGEAVAADGELLDDAAFDESLLTGESVPVAKPAGAVAYAGSICRETAARLRVQRTGTDTRLSQLARLVEHAQGQRPRIARIADQVASRFVWGLLLVAAAVALAWWRIDPARAFEVTLALLVVSCPCALSLAVPAALASAHGALARRGVLVLGEDALEKLATVDTVVLDKTGTLTRGEPHLAMLEVYGDQDADEVLAIAAALERDSGHPLARAFAGEAPLAAERVRAVPGMGVEGDIGGRHYRLGRADFVGGGHDEGAVLLGSEGFVLARFELEDAARPEAAGAIAALRERGLALEVLSGDGIEAVDELCDSLGIDRHAARQSPEDKLERIQALQAKGHRVLMIGDGLNDAPVLGGADVSIALARGADLAQRAADLVVTADSLARVPEALDLARRCRRVVRQNLAWALAYNLVALPFAALGWIGPGLAALGMAGSSLLVTGNALRLGRVGKDHT